MVEVRIVNRPAFRTVGRKTWIEGPDCGQFGRFWQRCHEDGLIALLGTVGDQPGPQTGGMVFGISCVEKDPENRDFYFFVAAECGREVNGLELEDYTVPAARWAVFRNEGPMPEALIEAEMYAFGKWLPSSGHRHAAAPELEVYPPGGEVAVEFWLPVE